MLVFFTNMHRVRSFTIARHSPRTNCWRSILLTTSCLFDMSSVGSRDSYWDQLLCTFLMSLRTPFALTFSTMVLATATSGSLHTFLQSVCGRLTPKKSFGLPSFIQHRNKTACLISFVTHPTKAGIKGKLILNDKDPDKMIYQLIVAEFLGAVEF
jgi:hypothetical protein